MEGSSWYETVDGIFHEVRGSQLTIFDNYLHSIARGAPNLEVLGFHGHYYQLSDFVSFPISFPTYVGLIHLGCYNERLRLVHEAEALLLSRTETESIRSPHHGRSGQETCFCVWVARICVGDKHEIYDLLHCTTVQDRQ